MKRNIFSLTVYTLLLAILITACQSNTKTKESSTNPVAQPEKTIEEKLAYPQLLAQLFEAHGGMEQWRSMQQLSFNKDGETTITALHSRKARIEDANSALGFDGEQVWLLEKNDQAYEGNPKFYYNLYFYFYAMPFVLGDAGIVYEEIPNLEWEGVSYPGMLISYKNGVGLSSKDQYKVYVHPETGKMAWLGYTVTYFSKEVSTEYSFIQYSNWQEVEGLTLPKTLTWYKAENNQPTVERRAVEFTDVRIQKTLDDALFVIPEGATVIE